MRFLPLLAVLLLQFLYTLLQIDVFLAGLVDPLIDLDELLAEPIVVAFVLVEFVLVLAVLLQHEGLNFLVSEFLML